MKTNLIFFKPTIGHTSCFRELLDLWNEVGFCQVCPIVQINSVGPDETMFPEARVWAGAGIGDVLCYDNTKTDKVSGYVWNIALFANEVLHAPHCSSWTFWPRWPRRFFAFQSANKIKSWEERGEESVFLGNLTTPARFGLWGNYVSDWQMGQHYNHFERQLLVPYEQYLSRLANARYGLCLPGQGPKCLRDVEYLGVATVPIFTPGCDTDGYYERLIEHKHFIRVSRPEEIPEAIAKVSKEEWEFMGFEGFEWFKRNCSLEGSFATTVKIIEELKGEL